MALPLPSASTSKHLRRKSAVAAGDVPSPGFAGPLSDLDAVKGASGGLFSSAILTGAGTGAFGGEGDDSMGVGAEGFDALGEGAVLPKAKYPITPSANAPQARSQIWRDGIVLRAVRLVSALGWGLGRVGVDGDSTKAALDASELD